MPSNKNSGRYLLSNLPEQVRNAFSEHLSDRENIVWISSAPGADLQKSLRYAQLGCVGLFVTFFLGTFLSIILDGFFSRANLPGYLGFAIAVGIYLLITGYRGWFGRKKIEDCLYLITGWQRALVYHLNTGQIEVYKDIYKSWSSSGPNGWTQGFQGWKVFPPGPGNPELQNFAIPGYGWSQIPDDLGTQPRSSDYTPHARLNYLPEQPRQAIQELLGKDDEVSWVARSYVGQPGVPSFGKVFLYGFFLVWGTLFFGGFASAIMAGFMSSRHLPGWAPFATTGIICAALIGWYEVREATRRVTLRDQFAYAVTNNRKAFIWQAATGQVEVYENIMPRGTKVGSSLSLTGLKVIPQTGQRQATTFKLIGIQAGLPPMLSRPVPLKPQAPRAAYAGKVKIDLPADNGLGYLPVELGTALKATLYQDEQVYLVRPDTRNHLLNLGLRIIISLPVYYGLVWFLLNTNISDEDSEITTKLITTPTQGYLLIALSAIFVLLPFLVGFYRSYLRHSQDVYAITNLRLLVGNPTNRRWLQEYTRLDPDSLEVVPGADNTGKINIVEIGTDSDGDPTTIRKLIYRGPNVEYVRALIANLFGSSQPSAQEWPAGGQGEGWPEIKDRSFGR